jgi:hypothetical protein
MVTILSCLLFSALNSFLSSTSNFLKCSSHCCIFMGDIIFPFLFIRKDFINLQLSVLLAPPMYVFRWVHFLSQDSFFFCVIFFLTFACAALYSTSFYPRLRPQISECFKIMFVLSCIMINAVISIEVCLCTKNN